VDRGQLSLLRQLNIGGYTRLRLTEDGNASLFSIWGRRVPVGLLLYSIEKRSRLSALPRRRAPRLDEMHKGIIPLANRAKAPSASAVTYSQAGFQHQTAVGRRY
jgi:hypothetical protein